MRHTIGGGGFVSNSISIELNKNCFLNCYSENIGPSFYSYVPNLYQQCNSSSIFTCSTKLYNGVVMDHGYQTLSQMNFSYNSLDKGLVYHFWSSISMIFKFGNIFFNEAKQTQFGLFGSYALTPISSTFEKINYVNNFAQLCIIHLHNLYVQNIFISCAFHNNTSQNLIYGSGPKVQFIECWGDIIMSNLHSASYNLCNFNNNISTHYFLFDFCKNSDFTLTYTKNSKHLNLLLILISFILN